VVEISKAKPPKPTENNKAAMSELEDGPCLSMRDPMNIVNGYWLIIAL